MDAGIAEISGFFVILVGLGSVVAAAAMVSTALAVLSAGVLLTFVGVIVVYLANRSAATPPKATP